MTSRTGLAAASVVATERRLKLTISTYGRETAVPVDSENVEKLT
jgi:hypothetical protein